MQILSSINHTNTETAERAASFYTYNAKKIFLKKISSIHCEPGSLDSQVSLNTANVTPCFPTSLFNCLFAVYLLFQKYQTTRSSPANSVTFHLTTVPLPHGDNNFEIHLAFQFPSCFSQQLDKWCQHVWHNSYHELISTKCTGACGHRVIPEKRPACIKKWIESITLMNTRETEFIALFFCVVGPGCCWDQWLEMRQTYLAKQKTKPGRPELSKRENWAVPQLCLSCHSHQGFYLLLCLKEEAGPQPSSPHQIHIHCMWHLHPKPEFRMHIRYQICA